MAHFEGPYVSLKSENHPGFCIFATGALSTLPVGIVPVNRRPLADVEDTARLFAAAPLLLKSLEVLSAAPDLDSDLLAIVLNAIDVATKDRL